ncbi:hypothetical protein GE09DRAFT_141316 [Coniochaeta sp. 2T2.1]|nr:hypothetical protein GE09DRAFT_141316 [Coniochaeta sp. 2T2.1]
MPRKWEHDGDDALVTPSGCVRCGYDTDTQTYTYQHPNGDLYEGQSGATYGPLRLVSRRASTQNTTDSVTSPRSQPPAYPPAGSSPPPYSQASQRASQPSDPTQTNRGSPAVTFDQIFKRHPTENDMSRNRQPAGDANRGPKRSVSLRSIFGSRRGVADSGNGAQQTGSRVLGRRATMGETYSSYKG